MKVQTEVTDAVKAKSKAKKLTDAMVRSYNRLDKDQIIPGDFGTGLRGRSFIL
tara:strand:+ start:118 stop:276 length:159 start_codon:yes stop_codon:yes gene_type:complete